MLGLVKPHRRTLSEPSGLGREALRGRRGARAGVRERLGGWTPPPPPRSARFPRLRRRRPVETPRSAAASSCSKCAFARQRKSTRPMPRLFRRGGGGRALRGVGKNPSRPPNPPLAAWALVRRGEALCSRHETINPCSCNAKHSGSRGPPRSNGLGGPTGAASSAQHEHTGPPRVVPGRDEPRPAPKRATQSRRRPNARALPPRAAAKPTTTAAFPPPRPPAYGPARLRQPSPSSSTRLDSLSRRPSCSRPRAGT